MAEPNIVMPRKDHTLRIRAQGGFPSVATDLLGALNKALAEGDTAALAKLSEPPPQQEPEQAELALRPGAARPLARHG